MFKKIVVGLVAIFATLLLINNSYAAINNIYTTDSIGGVKKTEFKWDETPWLYIDLNSGPINGISSSWSAPSGNHYNLDLNASADNKYWLSLSNWSDVKKAGKWDIYADWQLVSNGYCQCSRTYFTVNPAPEPISSALFLLGGATLALGAYRKKKQKL